jgi:hypothetical protein
VSVSLRSSAAPVALNVDIIATLTHEQLWRRWLGDDIRTWAAWFCFLRSLFGLKLSAAERRIFKECTGRTAPRAGGYLSATLICGRRAGKSLTLAFIAVFLAVFREWPGVAGERRVIVIAASTARQARNIHSYCRALLTGVPALAQKLVRETSGELDLDTGISIAIEVANQGSIRGMSVIAFLGDEIAHWQTEGASPDREVVTAVRAGMGTMPGAMTLIASSPYAKKGVLWEHYRRHFGKENSKLLCWKAASRTMNPTLRKEVVAEAMAEDPDAAAAEFMAEFRSDVVSFVDRAVVEDAVVTDRREVLPGEMPGLVNIVAHVDAAGGDGRDSMTLAIAGKNPETGRAILLCAREVRPQFSPEAIAAEYAGVIRSWGLVEAQADRFAGSWPKEMFEKHGVTLFPSKTSSEIFIDTLPLLMSAKVELLSNDTLINQLASLERRVGRGRDHVAASGTGHDDVALAACGALVRAAKSDEAFQVTPIFIADEPLGNRYEEGLRGLRMPFPTGDFTRGDHLVGTLEWQKLKNMGKL